MYHTHIYKIVDHIFSHFGKRNGFIKLNFLLCTEIKYCLKNIYNYLKMCKPPFKSHI